MQTQPILDAAAIRKRFHTTTALDGVSLAIHDGEFLALVGPSGCGKTTLLRIVGGFETPDSGTLAIGGRDMLGVPPAERPTAMVFQKLALFPHKTVAQNIGFPLKLRRTPAARMRARTREMLAMVQLPEHYLARYPRELSGGEQQRVALARAMIADPALLLLDEPLTALDATLRKSLQAELKRLHRELGVTFLHVTHDLEEAIMLADRICVMQDGQIRQSGTPADIYYRPESDMVAGFIGETNLFPVTVGAVDASAITYDAGPIGGAHRLPRASGSARLVPGPAHLMVRPELIRIVTAAGDAECSLRVTITERFIKGASIQYRARAVDADLPVVFEIPGTSTPPCHVGDAVTVGWDTDDVFVYPTSGTPAPEAHAA